MFWEMRMAERTGLGANVLFFIFNWLRVAIFTKTVDRRIRSCSAGSEEQQQIGWLPRQGHLSLAATSLPRQTPEVGAECVNSACSDLSSGRRMKPGPLLGHLAHVPFSIAYARGGCDVFHFKSEF